MLEAKDFFMSFAFFVFNNLPKPATNQRTKKGPIKIGLVLLLFYLQLCYRTIGKVGAADRM